MSKEGTLNGLKLELDRRHSAAATASWGWETHGHAGLGRQNADVRVYTPPLCAAYLK